MFGFGHEGEAEGQVEKTGEVHFLIDGTRAVGREKYSVIAVVGIARRRLAAHVGHDTGYNQILDFLTAQNSLQIGIIKR